MEDSLIYESCVSFRRPNRPVGHIPGITRNALIYAKASAKSVASVH